MFYAYGLAKADDFQHHLRGIGVVKSLEISKQVESTNVLKDVLLNMEKSNKSKKFKAEDVEAMVNEIKQMVNVLNTRKRY